ncbi:hypothetical protein V6N11_011405 [Hibiscus sabdariffa]|uniref:Uncharacterized protein n=1 Tax=Hibiscus sabdariffa TaxID=183260 RepID=A0ABR2S864_9ROSI
MERVKITVCGCCGLLYGEVGPHTEQVDGVHMTVDRLLLSGSSPLKLLGTNMAFRHWCRDRMKNYAFSDTWNDGDDNGYLI